MKRRLKDYIGIRVTDELREWLEDKVEETGESVSTIIRMILTKEMKKDQRNVK